MKKKLFPLIAAALLFAGCATDNFEPEVPSDGLVEMSFTAGSAVVSEPEVKTQFGAGYNVYWTPGDVIAVHDGYMVRPFTTDITAPAAQAVFRGKVSQGATSFVAMYPYGSVTDISVGTGTASFSATIPAVQTAVEASFDPAADIAFACRGTDGKLHFHNTIALLKFIAPAGSWKSVTIVGQDDEIVCGDGRFSVTTDASKPDGFSGGSASFTTTGSGYDGDRVTLSGDIQGGRTYYIAIAPTTFQKGLTLTFADADGKLRVARSDKPGSVDAGKVLNLGTPPLLSADPYKITSETDLNSLSDVMAAFGLTGFTAIMAQTMLSSYLSGTDQPLRMVNFTYTSLDPYGVPDTFSARMFIRKSTWTSGGSVSDMVLAGHYTIGKADECPTEAFDIHGALGWKDMAVIAPDYYGFGSTSKAAQAYLMRDATAVECLDAMVAGQAILKDKDISVTNGAYNIGYSQGGHTAIAVLRYLAEHPGEYDIDFRKTIAGAGPYDINGTYDWMMEQTYSPGAFSIPLTVISMDRYCKLGLDYSNIFLDPLLSNYEAWILSKAYTTAEINTKVGGYPYKIVTEGIMDGTSAEAQKLRTAFEANSLVSGWTPATEGEICLFHSTADDIVPVLNTQELKAFLESEGCTVTANISNNGTHKNAALQYALFLLGNL